MSKSSDLVFSLKQQEKALLDLRTSITRDLESLDEQIKLAIERSERISSQIGELRVTESQKDKMLSDLEAEVAELQNKLTRKKEELATIQNNLNQAKAKNQEVNDKVAAKEEQARNAKTSRELVERDLEDQRNRVKQLETELEQLSASHEENIKELREQVLSESKKLSDITNSHKAIKLLIKEKALDMPELAIIESLKNKNESSVDFIQRSTGLRRELVVQVIKGLVSYGLLDFIEESGAIKIKEPICI
ncbi:MAG: hypothetical protein ACTSW4_05730 [Candidatus Ranarchaeia archaeon]